ncbi:MAG: flagellar protein FlgN [Planctomycetota bacterium]|jgi:hypothetical protein
MDNNQPKELTRNLEHAYKLHAEILAAAKRKREGLVNMDLEIIRAVTLEEEELVDLVKGNEKERQEIVAAIADENGLDPEKVMKLRDIFSSLGEGAKKKVSRLRAELVKMAGTIRRINNINRLLAEQTLAHLHGFLSLFAGATGQDRGYGPAVGNGSASTIPLIVDRKA